MWCVVWQGSVNRMQYLLDAYIFDPEDLQLNREVLLWPQQINPIFDKNEEVSAHRLMLFAPHIQLIDHCHFLKFLARIKLWSVLSPNGFF